MFLIAILYLLIFKLFLAGKDASSYLLKDKEATGSLTDKRVKRWHRDGVMLDLLATLAVSYHFGKDWWQIFIVSFLLRLAMYDLAFNKWSSLNIHYLGSTAWADQQFAKLFGINGAIKKSLFFFAILVVFCIAKLKFNF